MSSAHITVEDSNAPPHDTHVAHHFESAQQQFDAGKLGMWLFLVTEVLFFSGLFVAYAVYRSHHPEVFVDAHKYLNTTLGAFNTIVLLLSSLTMAWAVRCAQLGQQRALVILLATTLTCASLFLGVKAVEYSHKWGEGLLWAGAYEVNTTHGAEVEQQIQRALVVLSIPATIALLVAAFGWVVSYWRRRENPKPNRLWCYLLITSIAFFVGLGIGEGVESFSTSKTQQASHSHIAVEETSTAASVKSETMTGVFFSIYYAMTGVHAIHILAGMGVIVWLLYRSLGGDFGPHYYGPVDYAGLYWHLVDLVWIYLFPLLYLIR